MLYSKMSFDVIERVLDIYAGDVRVRCHCEEPLGRLCHFF